MDSPRLPEESPIRQQEWKCKVQSDSAAQSTGDGSCSRSIDPDALAAREESTGDPAQNLLSKLPPPLIGISGHVDLDADILNQSLSNAEDMTLSSLEGHFLRQKSIKLESVRTLTPLRQYARLITRFPKCFIFWYVVVLLAVIIIGWRPVVLETSFEAFIRADGEAMRNRDAYLYALEERDSLQSRRLLSEFAGGVDEEKSLLEGRHLTEIN